MSSVEVVVKIDDTDEAMNRLLEQEASQRPFRVAYISSAPPADFYSLWESFDDILRATDPNAYFVVNLNDWMYFETKGWDTVLRRYVGLFPDHIFRLRTSKQRYRNYFDVWEAGFANDTSAIITKRWIDVCGGWAACNGPDTFQQCVAFYFGWLYRFKADRPLREIPVSEIEFGGAGTKFGANLKGRALRRRVGAAIRPWFILMSHKMQQEAARRAQKLHAHIWASQHATGRYEVRDEISRRRIAVAGPTGDILRTFGYRLSRLRIGLANAIRWTIFPQFGYVGDKPPWGPFQSFFVHLCLRYEYLGRLLDVLWFEADNPNRTIAGEIAFFILTAPSRAMSLYRRVWRQIQATCRL